MKTHFILMLLAFFVFSTVIQAQNNIEEPNFVQSASGQTVLLGTYTWDAETDRFPPYGTVKGKKSDIWWQQHNETEQSLVPQNGAAITQVRDKDFSELTIEDLKTLPYSPKPISNKSLVPGAVVAIRTAEGNFAKLKIVGYRALHDFSFKEAEILGESWKIYVMNQNNKPNYHLEVEWVIYTKQKDKRASL